MICIKLPCYVDTCTFMFNFLSYKDMSPGLLKIIFFIKILPFRIIKRIRTKWKSNLQVNSIILEIK